MNTEILDALSRISGPWSLFALALVVVFGIARFFFMKRSKDEDHRVLDAFLALGTAILVLLTTAHVVTYLAGPGEVEAEQGTVRDPRPAHSSVGENTEKPGKLADCMLVIELKPAESSVANETGAAVRPGDVLPVDGTMGCANEVVVTLLLSSGQVVKTTLAAESSMAIQLEPTTEGVAWSMRILDTMAAHQNGVSEHTAETVRALVEWGTARLRPASTSVRGLRPRFSWQPQATGESYVLSLFRPQGPKLWQTETTETTAAYPAALPELLAGASYRWTVEPQDLKPPRVLQGEFTILGAHEEDILSEEIRRLRQAVDEPMATPLEAALLISHGVYLEALDLLVRLEDPRPSICDKLEELAIRELGWAHSPGLP